MNETFWEGYQEYIQELPIIVATWDIKKKKPSAFVLAEGWDHLDNEERQEVLLTLEATLDEMHEHIVPDFLPPDLED